MNTPRDQPETDPRLATVERLLARDAASLMDREGLESSIALAVAGARVEGRIDALLSRDAAADVPRDLAESVHRAAPLVRPARSVDLVQQTVVFSFKWRSALALAACAALLFVVGRAVMNAGAPPLEDSPSIALGGASEGTNDLASAPASDDGFAYDFANLTMTGPESLSPLDSEIADATSILELGDVGWAELEGELEAVEMALAASR